jgi:hypothetical protein
MEDLRKCSNIGRQLLEPPASSPGQSNSQGIFIKSLPAVPAAALMVLARFLCVSLVRYHRIWSAALKGLLWVGHVGIQALPGMSHRPDYMSYIKQESLRRSSLPIYLDNSLRLRSDIEGTQYIGLLHHLAGIPRETIGLVDIPQ